MGTNDFIWGMEANGVVSKCFSSPENRGKGRCPHIVHQDESETNMEFIQRINSDPEFNYMVKKDDLQNVEVEFTQLKMTEEEMLELPEMTKILLADEENKGGRITLAEPIWNDMDINSYAKKVGVSSRALKNVLECNPDTFVCTDSTDRNKHKNRIGKIYSKEDKENLEVRYPGELMFGQGLKAMNEAAEKHDFRASDVIYVLPYEYRMNTERKDGELSHNELNTQYLNIMVANNKLMKNPGNEDLMNRLQTQYTGLLTNNFINEKLKIKASGTSYVQRSMTHIFEAKSKSGPIATMVGKRCPYSGRGVLVPNIDQPYGYVTIPPSMAINIFRPTIENYLKEQEDDEWTDKDINEFFSRFDHNKGVDQTNILQNNLDQLNYVLHECDCKAIFNRPPSLFDSNLLAFRCRVEAQNSIGGNPLNFEGYNADCDGDTYTAFGLNDSYMSDLADKMIGAKSDAALWNSRHNQSSLNKLSKESLWGMIKILETRERNGE